MSFNPDADVSNNRARRAGRGAVVGGGVVGLGGIAALVIALLTGGTFDLGSLLDGGAPSEGGQGSALENCQTGADANADVSCRIAASTLSLDQFWGDQVTGFRTPEITIVDGQTSTACGTASNAVGPFYCPSDETIYIDPSFFDVMREQFGTSVQELGQLYVVGHEYGHHIQYITGIMDEHPANGTGEDSNGVRTELQADCFAGGWIKHFSEQTDENGTPYLQAPSKQQLRDALAAAAAVGDDNIQRQSGGGVNPDSWTHGSSAERQQWFDTGYDNGITACDTFAG